MARKKNITIFMICTITYFNFFQPVIQKVNKFTIVKILKNKRDERLLLLNSINSNNIET